MANLRLDLRKTLRAIATAAQDANLERLLTGLGVRGESLTPRALHAHAVSSGRRARVRLLGVRVALSGLVGRLGVKSGAMLKDLSRRGNIKVGRTSFRVVPSPEVILRWRVFNAGSRQQEARPVSGMSGEQLDKASAEIAREARDQFVAALRDRRA